MLERSLNPEVRRDSPSTFSGTPWKFGPIRAPETMTNQLPGSYSEHFLVHSVVPPTIGQLSQTCTSPTRWGQKWFQTYLF